MRALLFALLCLVFSPLLLVGTLMFAFKVRFVNMPRGSSGTARRQALDFFDGRGLDVERFEPLGRESGRATPIGGLILAAVPDRSVAAPPA